MTKRRQVGQFIEVTGPDANAIAVVAALLAVIIIFVALEIKSPIKQADTKAELLRSCKVEVGPTKAHHCDALVTAHLLLKD